MTNSINNKFNNCRVFFVDVFACLFVCPIKTLLKQPIKGYENRKDQLWTDSHPESWEARGMICW